MSPIQLNPALAAALQSRLAAAQSRGRTPAPAAGQPAARAADAGGAAAAAMARRIAAIDRSDPDRRRKAVRVVLEAELARAFGPGPLNDPGFPHMLDAVQDQMQGDGQTAAAVHALGELLLAGPA